MLLAAPGCSTGTTFLPRDLDESQGTAQRHHGKMAAAFSAQAWKIVRIQNEEEHVGVNISSSTCVKAI